MSGVVAPQKMAPPKVVSTPKAERTSDAPKPATAGVTAVWKVGPKRTIPFIKYSLLWCPPVPEAVFVLSRKAESGERQALRIGRVESTTPIYNLAQLRHQAAKLGADEIHLHIPAAGIRARRRIERQIGEASQLKLLRCLSD